MTRSRKKCCPLRGKLEVSVQSKLVLSFCVSIGPERREVRKKGIYVISSS
jgi:hypothetical protein